MGRTLSQDLRMRSPALPALVALTCCPRIALPCRPLIALTFLRSEQLHKVIQSAILSTDMKYHGDFLGRFRDYLEANGTNPSSFEPEGKLLLMQMALKVSDIINPARRLNLAVEWGRRVMEEMYRQGDREAKLGLEVTPICDRSRNKPSAAQLFFIDKVLRPSLTQWGRVNRLGQYALDSLRETELFWQTNGDAEDHYILTQYEPVSFKSEEAPSLDSQGPAPLIDRARSPCRSSLVKSERALSKAPEDGNDGAPGTTRTGSNDGKKGSNLHDMIKIARSDSFRHIPNTMAGKKPSVIVGTDSAAIPADSTSSFPKVGAEAASPPPSAPASSPSVSPPSASSASAPASSRLLPGEDGPTKGFLLLTPAAALAACRRAPRRRGAHSGGRLFFEPGPRG